MEVIAKIKYLRIAPRKVRLLTDLIRGKSVQRAQRILSFTIKKGSDPILKLLKSAVANATNNFKLNESNLYISKILVDEGPKFKRVMPRARGSANEIQKKTSHITVVLSEIPGKATTVGKIEKVRKVKEIKEVKQIKEEPIVKKIKNKEK